jgi:hypothetical protein
MVMVRGAVCSPPGVRECGSNTGRDDRGMHVGYTGRPTFVERADIEHGQRPEKEVRRGGNWRRNPRTWHR